MRRFHTAFALRAQQNHYEVLGVSVNATPTEIKQRFYELSRKLHPDREGGDEERYQQVTAAYAVLSSEKLRRQFNSTLGTAVRRPEGYSSPSTRRGWYGSAASTSGWKFSDRYADEAARAAGKRQSSSDLDPLRPRAGNWSSNDTVRHFDFQSHRQRQERWEKHKRAQTAEARAFRAEHAPDPHTESGHLGTIFIGGMAASAAFFYLLFR